VHLPFPNSLYRAQAALFGFVAGAPDQKPGSTLKADRRRNIKIALYKACNVVGVCA